MFSGCVVIMGCACGLLVVVYNNQTVVELLQRTVSRTVAVTTAVCLGLLGRNRPGGVCLLFRSSIETL